VTVISDETLKLIARELVDAFRRHATVGWKTNDSVGSRLRTIIKRTLRKHDYPAEKREKVTQALLEDAEGCGIGARWELYVKP